jgi:hypothetical protein
MDDKTEEAFHKTTTPLEKQNDSAVHLSNGLYKMVVDGWNKQADGYNQWPDLGEDEKIEWAVKFTIMNKEALKV